ncbi:RIP metalloprotease RseP [Enterococcus saccharolyticus]|uniref:Zinc metalloprotease n=1 Tax=Enterococcus saccharolyticus subsp. saccharolyticus ATCC 43076 TaxID=1139996 RepID=S0JKT6_9ENTE|nr:RIP metalloprotease RseP [Enterococcus saccharolyticus]EOT28493.1 RIP metalloprotease RseP [Enterococcus saccharolyticus subsp. saccharolyticus ATCC 43076]EOT81484.1 RIP metalloprotease RseP [Enterococcus saccharolyticus subsp. saccharolyticus ATCC 43076]OJG87175.1 RIP metalloprotease RseP [Enterococcus saccharolyticus]
MKTVLVFLIVFSVVVVIHEFGHFYFAKRAGILVREFAIGMGPKLFSHQGKDGTTYTIRALPMGGYVRMAGYEEEEEIKAGMQVGLVLDQKDTVVKINTSHKVQLTNAIPLEVAQQDLVDALTITGYVNGDESQTVTYPVAHDAIIIEEDGTEVRIAPRDVQFQSAKLWQRMLTNFAGPMNNFLLTIAIFILAAFLNGGSADRNSTIINVVENGAAASAGLKDGDEIMAINQEPVENWAQVSQIIQANPEKELQIEVKRENQTQTFTAVPKAIEAGEQKVGQLGIQAPLKTGFFDKIIGGFQESIAAFFRIIDALRSLLTNFSIDQLGGPVAIFQLSSEAAKQGPMTVLMMTAMISINLGIFNLLPIPGLDGGKLLLNIIEGVRGKPLSQEKEGIITLVGFGLLMLLMVLVTWNDIQRFFF